MKNSHKTRFVSKAIIITFFTIIFASCSSHDNKQDFDVAHQLFEKTIRMTEGYIDSISNAPDSAALQKLAEHFDDRIATLNYQFPPDTDLLMSEDENDSIIRMHKRLTNIERKRLKAFSATNTDTIANAVSDSLKPKYSTLASHN